MFGLIFVGGICGLPLLGLGIAFLLGRGTKLVNTGRAMTRGYLRLLGICCLLLAGSCFAFGFAALYKSSLLLWPGYGLMGLGVAGILIGTFGSWLR